MSLWWLLVPFGTVVALAVAMVGIGLLVEYDDTARSVQEFDDFRSALGGEA